jgi:membrane-associated protease RseP (regulator of RpoE activity)
LKRIHFIQALLFVATVVSTTLVGAEFIFGRPFYLPIYPPLDVQFLGWSEFWQGLRYSVPFLGVLTVHEFGHYFMAKYHQVRVTLPYYIPVWLGGIAASFGTMGAFIKIEDPIVSRKKYFDIGIAGPLAGFVVALGLFWYGFANLPTLDYIFTIHPEYKKFGMGFARVVYEGKDLSGLMLLGDSLLFDFFKAYVADPTRLPPPQEIMHYPYILAGYLSLFFTALNLMPIGQLDGGHVLYALLGKQKFNIIAPILFFVFINYAGLGFFKLSEFTVPDDSALMNKYSNLALYAFFLYICFSKISTQPLNNVILALASLAFQLGASWVFPNVEGYAGFLAFGFLLGRILGVYHPPTEDNEPLDTKRKILGWIAIIVFILCFSPKPFMML